MVCCCSTGRGDLTSSNLSCLPTPQFQIRLVVQDPVEHVRGAAHWGVDDLDVVARELVGDVGVKQDAGVVAVLALR